MALFALSICPSWSRISSTKRFIAEKEVLAAQENWGNGIVAIGRAEDPKQAAEEHIEALYAYALGPVLFKPTRAAEESFRSTKEGALSYFVGGVFPEDTGFALTPFVKVRFENKGILIDQNSALAMGHYYFTAKDGTEVKAEYSFGYVKDKEGRLKINLHHSSLPYTASKTP